jgi:hypothetical protein
MNWHDNFNVLYRYIRIYILHLFGSVLFRDLTGRYVPLIDLTLLDDFDISPTYTWGFVVLAHLYRHLCLAFGGCLLLLQVWIEESKITINILNIYC